MLQNHKGQSLIDGDIKMKVPQHLAQEDPFKVDHDHHEKVLHYLAHASVFKANGVHQMNFLLPESSGIADWVF